MLPITIITGFLGAGKSTLLQHWLTELPKNDTAVIVNERGDIGVDGELLAAHVNRLREITGGCVCCRSQTELIGALEEMVNADIPPSRILIETSGAASPAGVVRAIRRSRDSLQLNGIITVLNAARLEEVLTHDLAVEQLAFADVVVLTHADISTDEQVLSAETTVGQLAPAAVVVSSSKGAPAEPLQSLLSQRTEVLRLPTTSTHSAIEAVALQAKGVLDEERFGVWVETALGRIESRIFRIKGILAMAGVAHRVIMQGVGESVEVTLGAPWGETAPTSRLVILGLGLDTAELETGFEGCRM